MPRSIPKNIEEYAEISEKLIHENKKIIKETYYVEDGLEFIELPGVFSHNINKTPPVFTRSIPYPKGGNFLEIGPGVGVVAVQAALQGARVIAIEINPDAVENTKINAQKHNVSVEAREGDLFDGLNSGETFDVIYWNIPFLPYVPTNRILEPLDHAIYDDNGVLLEKLLAQAKNYLIRGGLLILGYSDTHGSMGLFHALAQKYNWRVDEICRCGDYKTINFLLYKLSDRSCPISK